MRGFVVVALLCVGCIRPNELTCGDQLCAAGTICLAGNRCASSEEVAACAGLADGATCQTSVFAGTCSEGACAAPVCGNGIVEANEQCDGPVTDVDCVLYGFDLGVPTCTSHCDLDVIDGCTRFGWRPFASVEALFAWTDGNRLVVARGAEPYGVDVYIAGTKTASIDGNIFMPASSSLSTFVIKNGELWRATDGDFAQIDLPAMDGPPSLVVADSDDTLFVTISGCEIYRRAPDGTWTQIRDAGPDQCYTLVAANGELVVPFVPPTGPTSVERWSNGSWTPLFTSAANVLGVADRGGVVWAATSDGLTRDDTGVVTASPFAGGADRVVPTADGAYFSGASSYGRLEGDRGLGELFSAPIAGQIMGDDTDHLYVFGSGIYVYSGTEFATHGSAGAAQDAARQSNGDVIFTEGLNLGFRSDFAGWASSNTGMQARELAPRGNGDVYVTDGTTLAVCGTPCTPVAAPFVGIHDLWAPFDGEPSLYAVGDAGLGLVMTSGTWTTIALPSNADGCDLQAVDGNASQVAAVGACGGVGIVWTTTGTTWVEAYRGGPPLVAVAVTTDNEVTACGASGGVRSDHGTWIADANAAGQSISATTSSDVFIANATSVIHWDGVGWSRLSVVGAVAPRVVATVHAVYFLGAESSVLLR